MENKKHQGNYVGTNNMQALNQDLEFVNDTLGNAKNTTSVNVMKDDTNEVKERVSRNDEEEIQG